MIYEYNVEILDKSIAGKIDIPEPENVEDMNEFEYSDYLYSYLTEQIKNSMQIYIYE